MSSSINWGGIDLSDITAQQQDVLTGKKFVNKDGDLIEGTYDPASQVRDGNISFSDASSHDIIGVLSACNITPVAFPSNVVSGSLQTRSIRNANCCYCGNNSNCIFLFDGPNTVTVGQFSYSPAIIYGHGYSTGVVWNSAYVKGKVKILKNQAYIFGSGAAEQWGSNQCYNAYYTYHALIFNGYYLYWIEYIRQFGGSSSSYMEMYKKDTTYNFNNPYFVTA